MTDVAGRFHLLTTLVGPVVVHYESTGEPMYARRHLLINLSNYTALGVHANATVNLKRVNAIERPGSASQPPGVAAGGLFITPVTPEFMTADGAAYEGEVAMTLTVFNPFNFYGSYFKPDMSPAIDPAGIATTMQSFGASPAIAWGCARIN